MGLHWVGVELEQPFCDLGQGCDCTGINKADWVRFFGRWERARYLDGRHWCPECLADARVVIERNGQLPMFDMLSSTSYVRNSGKIPCTTPHHYQGNIERWESTFGKNGASAVLLQGDSRCLGEVVGEAGRIVSSPPYASRTVHGGSGLKLHPDNVKGQDDYSTNPANLGNMATGDYDVVLSSPPFGTRDQVIGGHQGVRTDYDGQPECHFGPGNLVAMPPGSVADGLDAVIASPPWESVETCQDKTFWLNDGRKVPPQGQAGYGNSNGQLGQESGSTFWSAARTILQQCHQVLKPGAVAVWVVKAFVRDKKRVDFPGQWRRLCESCGFETVHVHRAYLTEDRGNACALFDFEIEDDDGNTKIEVGQVMHLPKGKRERPKGATLKRASFFRRLAESKGSPSIDYEVVLCTRKI